MLKPLRVLIIEDSDDDVQLLLRELRKGGFDPIYTVVETATTLQHALETQTWDIVISDHSMPQFDAPAALKIIRDKNSDLPFILVSGSIGEDKAVEIMKSGAQDYITKDNLKRFIPAIDRELAEAVLHQEKHKADEALRLAGKEWRATFDAIADAVCLLDREGKVLRCNKSFQGFIKKSYNEIISQYIWKLVYGTEEPPAGCVIRQVRETKTRATTLMKIDSRWLHVAVDPMLNDSGHLLGAVFILADITDLEETRESLRISEEKYRILFENASEGIVVIQDGKMQFVNPKVSEFLGYSIEELKSSLFLDFIFLDDKDWVLEKYMSRLGGNATPHRYELRIIDKQGNIKWVGNNSVPIVWEGSAATLAFLSDINDRKLAEAALRTSEAQLANAMEIAHLGHWEYDVNKDLFIFNDHFYSIFHTSADQIGGYTMSAAEYAQRFLHPDDAYIVAKETQLAMASPDPNYTRQLEHRIKYADGGIGYITVKFYIVKDSQGRTVKTFGVNQDVTERKESEQKIEESYSKLRRTLEETVNSLASALETRDPYTAGHERRDAQLASAIARQMELSEDRIEGIRIGSLLHDIGKISVPAEILSKPGKLTILEFELIKAHPQVGFDILKDIEFPWPVAQIVYQHQERCDGSGYPQGLKGNQIILEARILAVADVVEAMSSHRPYRPALGIDIALAEIEKNKGILYEPVAVDACLRLFRDKRFKFE